MASRCTCRWLLPPCRLGNLLPLLLACAARQAAADWCRPTPGGCHGRKQSLREVSGSELPLALSQGSTWKIAEVRAVDWNGDGLVDLLLGGRQPDDSIRYFEGTVAGAFEEVMGRQPFSDIRAFDCFTAADWNGDGRADILVGNSSGVHLWTQRGDGRAEYSEMLLRVFTPSMAAADWDNDGRVDLFLGTFEYYHRSKNGSLIFQGGGGNPWAGLRTEDLHDDPAIDFSVVDFDGDGSKDIILQMDRVGDSPAPSPLRYYQRMADGSLTDRQGNANPFNGMGISFDSNDGLVAVDWNGDGLVDLITLDRDGRLRFFASSLNTAMVELTGGLSPFNNMALKGPAPALADWNGDGQLHLLLASRDQVPKATKDGYRLGTAWQLHLLERDEDGSFLENVEVPFAVLFPDGGSIDILTVKAADFDGDGDIDLMTLGGREFFGTRQFQLVYFERLDGNTLMRRNLSKTPLAGLEVGELLVNIEAADWDGDGDPDLITIESNSSASGSPTRMRYFENSANATLWQEHEGAFAGITAEKEAIVSIAATDWNADGRLDLVLGSVFGLRYFERSQDGMFSFTSSQGDGTPFAGVDASFLRSIAFADVNGDGNLDMVAGDGSAHGEVRYFSAGFCDVPESCSGRGVCRAVAGVCSCIGGHWLHDCSGCSRGFFMAEPSVSVYSWTYSSFRSCRPCPGIAEAAPPCLARGFCRDDNWACGVEDNAAKSLPLNVSSLRGNGTCHCNPPFHGKACELGTCHAGYEYSQDMLFGVSCTPCKPGFHKHSRANAHCSPCQGQRFADASGHVACAPCESTWVRKKVNMDRTSCDFDHVTLVVAPAVLLLSIALFLVLVLMVKVPLKIQDVRLIGEEGVVVTTRRRHWLLPSLDGVSIRFQQTGHPDLDSSESECRVRVRAETQMLLLDSTGKPVVDDLDTSKGLLCFTWWSTLTRFGLFHVPFGFWALLLIAVLVCIVMTADGQRRFRLTVLEALQVPLGLVFALFVHSAHRARHSLSRLDADLRDFAAALARANPDPRPLESGAGRAMSLGQLLDFFVAFEGHIGSRTMYYICSNILLPLTEPWQLSYAELAGPKTLQWFCSHYWGAPFAHFVRTVRRHAQVAAEQHDCLDFYAATYWICTFSNNQWKAAEEVGVSWEHSSFYIALRSGFCRGTVLILDQEVTALTRSWCLFELLQTSLLSREQEQHGNASFRGLLLCTPTGVMNYGQSNIVFAAGISKKLASLRLQDATASVARDKEMIDRLVCQQAGGFHQVNRYLIQAVSAALQATKTCFQEELSELQQGLDSALGQHAAGAGQQESAGLLGRAQPSDAALAAGSSDSGSSGLSGSERDLESGRSLWSQAVLKARCPHHVGGG